MPTQFAKYNSATGLLEHTDLPTEVITVTFDGGSSVIPAATELKTKAPYGCTVVGWQIESDTSCTAVIDVRKNASSWPTGSDSISGTEDPTLTATDNNQDLTLTTWTTAIALGDFLSFYVVSNNNAKRIILKLLVLK